MATERKNVFAAFAAGLGLGLAALFVFKRRTYDPLASLPSDGKYRVEEVTPGVYKHFKGNYYLVYGVAGHSEMPMGSEQGKHVVYRCLYDNHLLCIRPKTMFTETVTRDGQTFKRFTYLPGVKPADVAK